MIKFEKSIYKVLPYDRDKYIEFLNDNIDSLTEWNGVSFQLPGVFEGKDIGLKKKFNKVYANWIKNIISNFDNGSPWIVNHDRKGADWFPNNENNLPLLRTLFKQNNVPNTFKGALVFSKDDLLKFLRDIISYPYAVFDEDGLFYMDLDISYRELPFIIKIPAHLNIDLLSTDKELLKKVVNENSSSVFVIKEYRGTSL